MKDYYETNAAEYHASTVRIDPGSFLEPLARCLTPGATILDIGCGSGRDMRWFKERGFKPTGFERSPSLAEMARSHSGCSVIEGDFEIYDFSGLSVDAVVMTGALVHIPHDRFKAVSINILQALVPGGHALITLKEGPGPNRNFPRPHLLPLAGPGSPTDIRRSEPRGHGFFARRLQGPRY